MSRLPLALGAALAAGPALAAPPAVVTDFAPVHALVAQVMGDLGAPVLLMDQGADPHSFQLRPSQARALAGADLLFWIGPELTPWLDRAREGTGMAGESVALLHAPGTLTLGFDEAEAHGDAHDHDHHGHDGLDPHAWLDPANAAVWLDVIAGHLAAADPANAATYAANAEAARARIASLDARLRERLAPAAARPLFVYHDAYGYLAAAYGLTVAGALAGGDAAQPGAAGLSAERALLEATPGACVFAEADHDPAPMQVLVEGTGLALGTLDPSGTRQTPGPDLYEALMNALAAAVGDCAG